MKKNNMILIYVFVAWIILAVDFEIKITTGGYIHKLEYNPLIIVVLEQFSVENSKDRLKWFSYGKTRV